MSSAASASITDDADLELTFLTPGQECCSGGTGTSGDVQSNYLLRIGEASYVLIT